MNIIGYYNRQGYRIGMIDDGGQFEQLYDAGNNRNDSDRTNSVPLDSPNALPLRTIRAYCIQTGKEIAKEQAIEFVGAEREEEFETA